MGTSNEGVLILTPVAPPRVIDIGRGEQPLQDIYETSETQKHALDSLLVYPDGRAFRYAKNGAVALSKALMTQAAALETKCTEELQTTSGANVEIGDVEIIVDITTGSSLAENAYANGHLVVNKSTGLGDYYKVVASKLVTGDDTKLRLLLETPIRTALGGTSEITLVASKRSAVIVFPTTATGSAAGVPLVDVAIGYYFWAQVKGACPGIVDAGDTIVVGEPVGKPGTHGTAGGFGLVANDGTDDVWGRVMYVATAGEAALIDLQLE